MMEYNKEKYFNELIGKVYKLLPIYEGKSINSDIENINPEKACGNYHKELLILSTKIMGDYSIYNDQLLLDIASTLKGMMQFEVGQHTDVKICVFGLIKKIKNKALNNECDKNEL